MSSSPPAPQLAHQDFVKGWPHPSFLERPQLRKALSASFSKAITDQAASALNYGTVEEGAYMLGNPSFLSALARFLQTAYGREVRVDTLMSTSGASMGIDLCGRAHAVPGDYAICEKPTYFLAHQMFRERGLHLKDVGVEPDGMDLDALEELVVKLQGKCKLVYTMPIHQNPTGVTMSQTKRDRLARMARQYGFFVIADEAYQLLNFREERAEFSPLYYEDDPCDPRIFSVGTFSKLVGPGLKIGWLQADPSLLKPVTKLGVVESGNNPVTFSSTGLIDLLDSGALQEHIRFISGELARKCTLLCKELRALGYEMTQPRGGYFVWVRKRNEKMTGRDGTGMALDPPDEFAGFMRLCFAWLDDEQIVSGVRVLR
jgi:DNA-binding transcriptional MocR family regulator